jgi:pilus assembly protein CpaF
MFDIIIKEDETDEVLASVRCETKTCTIGKGKGNLVRLSGWRIGGVHAELFQNEKGIFLEDKGTNLGTKVNTARVQTYGPLRSSDVIEIDSYRLQVGIAAGEDVGEFSDDAGRKEPTLKQEPVAELDEPMAAAQPAETARQTPEPAVSEAVGSAPVLKSVLSFDEMSDDELALREEKQMWRGRIHGQLLRMMDLRRTDIEGMDEASLREKAREIIYEIIDHIGERLPGNIDKDELANDVLNEAIGLGPLEELLADKSITEIMVNRFDDIYIEREGKLIKSTVQFSNDAAVLSAIERIVSPLGRRIDESSPMVDARLKDGSRVNAVIPPLALRGPCVTIRKFSDKKLTADDIIAFGAAEKRMVAFLKMAVEQRKNIVIAGGTGSGKTTLLNVLSNFIPADERIVTVEDAAELKLVQPHIVSLEARPPNMEGKGAITIRDLVKNCLRMRPDRIVVGECRGGEALDMLQAMNTGHDGSLTTAHANSPRDTISRLEVMVLMAGMDLPASAIREQVASAVDLIVQQSRFSDGSRKITHICEITGVEQNIIQMQDIFRYRQTGIDENGKVTGYFEATGQIPEFYEDLASRGIPVDMSIFKD